MLPGAIYSQNGKVLQFQIETAFHTGAVTASDPSTGERFAGQYVGILEQTTATASGIGSAGYGFAAGSVGSNIADATAYLTGDKGTTLTCEMRIQAGHFPHGIGHCADNRGCSISFSSEVVTDLTLHGSG
jgi:hypothetical protein